MASGGVIWMSATDGVQRALDADTGEVLYELNLGGQASVQPSIGADSDGNIILLRVLGGPAFNFGNDAPGAIMAYGLPDVLPEPEIEIREVIVEVPGPEVIVEVPGPEVIVEVPLEVQVQVISPISYVAIGVGVVLVVVAGILFSRRRST